MDLNNVNKKKIGLRIKAIRNELGLTMNEFGQKFEPSASDSIVSRWERGISSPNSERIQRIAELGNVSTHYLITGQQTFEDYYNSMTPEEKEQYHDEEFKRQIKQSNIMEYQKKRYVRIEDFLGDTKRKFYIDDSLLSVDDIKKLISLHGGKEKNYPSDEQIEQEFEKIKAAREENKRKIESGEAFYIMDDDYDVYIDDLIIKNDGE